MSRLPTEPGTWVYYGTPPANRRGVDELGMPDAERWEGNIPVPDSFIPENGAERPITSRGRTFVGTGARALRFRFGAEKDPLVEGDTMGVREDESGIDIEVAKPGDIVDAVNTLTVHRLADRFASLLAVVFAEPSEPPDESRMGKIVTEEDTVTGGVIECPQCRFEGPHTFLGREGGTQFIECGNGSCYHEFEMEIAK